MTLRGFGVGRAGSCVHKGTVLLREASPGLPKPKTCSGMAMGRLCHAHEVVAEAGGRSGPTDYEQLGSMGKVKPAATQPHRPPCLRVLGHFSNSAAPKGKPQHPFALPAVLLQW